LLRVLLKLIYLPLVCLLRKAGLEGVDCKFILNFLAQSVGGLDNELNFGLHVGHFLTAEQNHLHLFSRG
jgi:hypothetical protein